MTLRIVKRTVARSAQIDPLVLKLCEAVGSPVTSACAETDARIMASHFFGDDFEQMRFDAGELPGVQEELEEKEQEVTDLTNENEALHEAFRETSLPAYLLFLEKNPSPTNWIIEAEAHYDEIKRLRDEIDPDNRTASWEAITAHERRLLRLQEWLVQTEGCRCPAVITQMATEIKERGTYADNSPVAPPKPEPKTPTRKRSKS